MNENLFDSIVSYSQHNGASIFIACSVVGIAYSEFLTWASVNKIEMLPMVRQLEQSLPTLEQMNNSALNAGYLSMNKINDITIKKIYRKNDLGEMELFERHEIISPSKPNYQLINGLIVNKFTNNYDDDELQINIPTFETPNGETYSIGE